MTNLARIFWRGFSIVTVTALNVGQVAGQHYGGALVGGFLISFIWWMNAQSAAKDHLEPRTGSREAYGTGAALGTVFGMALCRLFYG